MSKKHNASLHLTLRPSRRLKWLLGFTHLFAMLACLSSFLPIINQFVLFLVLLVHFKVALRRLKNDSYAINYTQVSGWEIAKNDGFVAVGILPTTVVTRCAVFLHIEIQGVDAHIPKTLAFVRRKNRESILILADMLSDEAYRGFVVTLKTAAIKSGRRPMVADKI